MGTRSEFEPQETGVYGLGLTKEPSQRQGESSRRNAEAVLQSDLRAPSVRRHPHEASAFDRCYVRLGPHLRLGGKPLQEPADEEQRPR